MRITLGHEYHILSSGAMHSYIADTQNYMHSRHYAICKYEGFATHQQKQWDYLRHSPVYERLRPKPAVSVGLLALAEDKRPEANWLIELRPYALQRHILTCQNLHLHCISWSLIKSMMQSRIANYGEAENIAIESIKRIKHSLIAITQRYVLVVNVPNTEKQMGTHYVQVEVMIWDFIRYNLIWWIAWYYSGA